MERSEPKGYIRERGGKLQAVLVVEGRKIRRAIGYDVGQEDAAQRFLDDLLRELARARGGAQRRRSVACGQGGAHPAGLGRPVGGRAEGSRRDLGAGRGGPPPLPRLPPARRHAPARPEQGPDDRLGAEPPRPAGRRVREASLGPLRPPHRGHRPPVPRRGCRCRPPGRQPVHLEGEARPPLQGRPERPEAPFRGFRGCEVWELLHNKRVPGERRVLYAIEFLTGVRTGEVAARKWKDLDASSTPPAKLQVYTSWNSRARLEKRTKTLVEKVVPVHPLLTRIFARWRAEGFARYVGHAPEPDDLLVPSDLGRRRSASHSNRLFQDDVRRLGLATKDGQAVHRTHCETRATFRSLALAGGAVREDLDLITHPSPRQASDLYTRLDEVRPLLCRAVECVQVAPRDEAVVPPAGRSQRGSQSPGETPAERRAEKGKAPRREASEPSGSGSHLARDTGLEPVALSSGG